MRAFGREVGKLLVKKMFIKRYATIYQNRDLLGDDQKKAAAQAVQSFRRGDYYQAWKLVSDIIKIQRKSEVG